MLAQLQNAQNKLYATAKKPAAPKNSSVSRVETLKTVDISKLVISPKSPSIQMRPPNLQLTSYETRKSQETLGPIDSFSSSEM